MRYSLFFTIVSLCLTGCTLSQQNLQDQGVAKIDAQLMVLDLQSDNVMDARMHLNEAESLAPKDPEVLIAAGYFDEKMGDSLGAKQSYQTAIQEAPDNAIIENSYGAYLYGQGQYQQALSYFLKAAQNPANSVSAEAFENAGMTELKLSQPALAHQDFMRALEENPNLLQSTS